VFNNIKRSLESDGPITSWWAARTGTEYISAARSIFVEVSEGEPYVLITSCSDVVDFFKSSKSDLVIGLMFDS
jgi:hypothetical protein